jgi:hypothetical protein
MVRARIGSIHRILSPLGAIAQLGERLLCKQEVAGSIPAGSIEKIPAFEQLSIAVRDSKPGSCSPAVFPRPGVCVPGAPAGGIGEGSLGNISAGT